MATRGWHKISIGWYRYTNAAGKTLAYAERYRSFWDVRVLPLADAAQAVTLSASPSTLREAKEVAERAYASLSESALSRQEAALRLHGHPQEGK